MGLSTQEQLVENKILLAKLPSIRNSYRKIIDLKNKLETVFSIDGLDGVQKDALETITKDVNDKLLVIENHLKFLDATYNKIPRIELSDDEKRQMLVELIISSYIKGIRLTTDICEVELGFGVDEAYLLDEINSYRGAISIEIQSQMEKEKPSEKNYNKLEKRLRKFDFSKYEDMSIEDLRSLLIVHTERDNKEIITDKLIKNKYERTCVGIYALAKGGTYIYLN